MKQNIYPVQIMIRRKDKNSGGGGGPTFKGDIQTFVKQLKTMYSNVGDLKEGLRTPPEITMRILDYAYCHNVLDPTASEGYYQKFIYSFAIPKALVSLLKTTGRIELNIVESAANNPYGSRGVFYPNPYTLYGTVNTFAIGTNGAWAYDNNSGILSNIAPTPTSIVLTPDGTTNGELKFSEWYSRTNDSITVKALQILPTVLYNNELTFGVPSSTNKFIINLFEGSFKTVLDESKDLIIIAAQ